MWLAQGLSFVIETNAASERDYALFKTLKKAGYRLEFRYVGLDSVALCRTRVAQRVREGGHNVPPALIEQRYANGLSLVKQHYRLFDRIQLYDNTGTETRLVADIVPGQFLQVVGEPLAWAAPVTAHIEKMEAVYRRFQR